METMLRPVLLGVLGAALLAACASVLDSDSIDPAGVTFSYSGSLSGSFASNGNAVRGGDGLPAFETFAVAQRDSIDGLLLGSFRKTGGSHGDLFILQIRGTDPITYTCGAITDGPRCYGHLYIGVQTEGSASAEHVYGISAGQVVLSEVSDSRVKGTFQLALQGIRDPSRTLTIENGSFDVPLVEGIFNSSFACLALRLEKGPDAVCE